jgi:hypothetical protein
MLINLSRLQEEAKAVGGDLDLVLIYTEIPLRSKGNQITARSRSGDPPLGSDDLIAVAHWPTHKCAVVCNLFPCDFIHTQGTDTAFVPSCNRPFESEKVRMD